MATLRDIVEVIESAAEALVPYRRVTESKTAVGTQRETGRVDRTGLWWRIELELIVRGDITGSSCLVVEYTVVQCDCENPSLLTL